MTSDGKQTIAIYIMPNISKIKGNQTMKLRQEIEYNMRIIFIKRSHNIYRGETVSRPFSKKSKLSISLG